MIFESHNSRYPPTHGILYGQLSSLFDELYCTDGSTPDSLPTKLKLKIAIRVIPRPDVENIFGGPNVFDEAVGTAIFDQRHVAEKVLVRGLDTEGALRSDVANDFSNVDGAFILQSAYAYVQSAECPW